MIVSGGAGGGSPRLRLRGGETFSGCWPRRWRVLPTSTNQAFLAAQYHGWCGRMSSSPVSTGKPRGLLFGRRSEGGQRLPVLPGEERRGFLPSFLPEPRVAKTRAGVTCCHTSPCDVGATGFEPAT